MTFLAPVWIALAAAASVVAAAIHLIAWRLPRTVELPTARFVPDEPARRAARTIRPADLALLALRIGILMAAGVGLARPVFRSTPSGSAMVIAIDVSAATDTSALLDSLRSIPRGDVTSFVVFDTSAQVISGEAGVARVMSPRRVPEASLSVGLLAATREARRLSPDYERVDMVLVSPLTAGSFDDGTSAIRGTWPDSVRLIRVAAALEPPPTNSVEITSADDPVLAGIRLARSNGLLRGESRVIRDAPTSQDSAWVDSGRVLVLWPRLSGRSGERVDAVHAGGYTAIGYFIPQAVGDSGRVAARWADGRVAAREISHRTGCIRSVGFDVPDVGDFALTAAFQRLVSALLAPCGGRGLIAEASDSLVARLIPPASSNVPPGSSDARNAPNRIAALILVVAILLALIELLVRRRYSPVAP